ICFEIVRPDHDRISRLHAECCNIPRSVVPDNLLERLASCFRMLCESTRIDIVDVKRPQPGGCRSDGLEQFTDKFRPWSWKFPLAGTIGEKVRLSSQAEMPGSGIIEC